MSDFYSDQGALLARYFGSGGYVPDYVMDGDYFVEPTELNQKKAAAFADPAAKEFPIYDKCSTFISNVYALANDVPSSVRNRIRKQALLFGIAPDLARTEKYFEELERRKSARRKKASPNEWRVEMTLSGYEISLGGSGRESVKRACETILDRDFEAKFPLGDRKKLAEAIIERCPEECRDEIPDRLYKTAGMAVPNLAELKAAVVARSLLLPEDERYEFVKTASLLDSIDDEDKTPDKIFKIAEFIDKLDKTWGFTKFYNKHFPDPIDSVYTYTYKQAAAMTAKVKVAGREFYRDEFHDPEILSAISTVVGHTIDESNIDSLSELEGMTAEAVAGIMAIRP